MAENGAVPNFPILLFHGYGSCRLKVEEGHPDWKNQRVWLSFAKLGLSKFQTFSFNRPKEDTGNTGELWVKIFYFIL